MVQSYQEMWDQSLTALAQRRGAVEVTRLVSREDGVDMTYRARLLHFNPSDGRLRIEQVEEVPLQPDSKVKVVVTVQAEAGPSRCQGVCSVGQPIKLNMSDGALLVADDLAPAGAIEQVQRRSFFRVDAGGAPLPPMTLKPDEPGSWPMNVNLVNISAGGVGVSLRASPEQAKTLPRCSMYECKIPLPELDDPIMVAARLVHFKVLPKQVLYLGLKFQPVNKAERHDMQETIIKFITQQQRKQLQRQRGTG